MQAYKNYHVHMENVLKNIENCTYSETLLRKIELFNVEAVKLECHTVDIETIKRALIFAKTYHLGQFRKSGEPYFSHPIAVAIMVMDYIFKTDVIVAAILHDTIEDTELTYEIIRENFGTRVEQIVYRLTRVRNPLTGIKPKVEDKLIESLECNDNESLIIKVFDRLHNIQTISSMRSEKQIEIIKETIQDFLVITMHICSLDLEGLLSEYCNEIISNKKYITVKEVYKYPFSFNNYSLPSIDFQSDIE